MKNEIGRVLANATRAQEEYRLHGLDVYALRMLLLETLDVEVLEVSRMMCWSGDVTIRYEYQGTRAVSSTRAVS